MPEVHNDQSIDKKDEDFSHLDSTQKLKQQPRYSFK